MALAPYLQMVNAGDLVTVKARIQSAGAATNAPDFQVPAGTFSAATHASTGVYTVTMAQGLRFPVFLGGFGHVMTADVANAGGDALVHIAADGYVASTGVLTFQVTSADGSTAVEAVADDEWIYLELNFCRKTSSATNASGAIPPA